MGAYDRSPRPGCTSLAMCLKAGASARACGVQAFVAAWAGLVTDVLALAPEAAGRLLLDIMNEPDGCAPKAGPHWAVKPWVALGSS